MAIHLKLVIVTCLFLLVLMEDCKPTLAKKGEQVKQRIKILEKSVAELKDRVKVLEECQSCSKIKELNDAINELRDKIDPNPTPAVTVLGLEDSEILKQDASYLKILSDFLKPVVHTNSQWKRCWQASVDGWEAKTFHTLCDDKGPTVTIIRVDHKYIFGGYTSISWSSSCDSPYDSAAFLFSLVNKPGWQPLKLNQTEDAPDRGSIYGCNLFGPTFGCNFSPDVIIGDNRNYQLTYSNLGCSYSLTGYGYKSPFALSFLAGSFSFQPDEVEVFYETT